MAREDFPIFIAGHTKDEAIMQRLISQISVGLRIMKHVQLRSPLDLTAGDVTAEVLDQELNKAQFIILLISSHFLNALDEYDYWAKAATLHKNATISTRILPILVSPCMHSVLGIEDLQDVTLFAENKPLRKWGDDETPYCDFAEQLIGLINETEKKQTVKSRSPREQKKFANILTQLNFTEQPSQFIDSQMISQAKFSSNKAFAYLIKGQYGHGQDWLYHILRQKVKHAQIWEELEDKEEVAFYQIPMSFNSLTVKTNPALIWKSLGKTLRISINASSTEIVDHIWNKLATTQIVIFRFDNFGELNEEMGREFMETFWKTIVDAGSKLTDGKDRFPVLLFLLHQNHLNTVCPETFLDTIYEKWSPEKGIYLKELDKLSEKEISDWFGQKKTELVRFDRSLTQTIIHPAKRKALIEKLLCDSDEGLPEQVLEKVSNTFNFRFFDLLDQLAENE